MTPSHQHGTLIIGASQAGLQVATSLRELGDEAPITLVGAESHPPYQRPPLSKSFLLGQGDATKIALRSLDFYAERGIDLILGTRIVEVRAPDGSGAGRAIAADGREFWFDRLALTVGGRPRRLSIPGADLEGVHCLRDVSDAESIAAGFANASHLVVVGGGFIGLEAAAAARAKGVPVTVVEASDRLMSRSISPLVSSYFTEVHLSHGVRIEVNALVTGFQGRSGHVTGVQLADGTTLEADMVLVGVGLEPRIELARQLGLECDRGIVVDHRGQTSHPAVVAAGDCVSAPHPHGEPYPRVSLESVQATIAQAKAAAGALLGQPDVEPPIPWFWSDQFDLKLQIAGLTAAHDLTIVRGEPSEGSFSVVCYRDSELLGVEAVNRPLDFMAIRKALEADVELSPADLADIDVPIKQLLKDRLDAARQA